MLTLIKKHYKSLKFTPVPYSEYSHIISAAKKSNPMVWIPGWKLTDQKNKELRSVNILAGTVTLNKPTTENAVEKITKANRDAWSALRIKGKFRSTL